MGTIEFVEKVLEVLRDMDDAVDVICNLDAKTVVERMKFADVIIIPDGATNGDMIKAIFPQWDLREEIGYEYKLFGETHKFEGLVDEDWWNKQYNKGEGK